MFKIKDIVLGEVTGITEYGIFVKINDKVNGLIHISEVSNNFINDLHDFAKVNDKICCEILDIIDENKLKLSIKNINYILVDRYDNGKISDHGFIPLKEKLPEWIAEKIA